MTVTEETRRKLVDKFLKLAETFPDTPLGMMFGAVGMMIELRREADFLHRHHPYFVSLLKEMHGADGIEREELTYEEKEFFRKFTELAEEPDEEFPDEIG
jgi:hypothetical protein